MKLPQFIVLVSLTVGPQLPSWQSLFSHGLTCQGGCLPFAPWPQLLVHLQRWAAVRIEPLVGKAAEALLLVAAVEARLLRNIYIYRYIYNYIYILSPQLLGVLDGYPFRTPGCRVFSMFIPKVDPVT